MSKKEPKIARPSEEEVARYAGGQSAGGMADGGKSSSEASAEEAASVDEAKPASEVDALKAELAETKDRLLRAMAEFQNQRIRAARERDEAVRYANSQLVRSLLVVLDDFERALEAARKAESVEGVVEGVRIVYDHMLKILGEHGVTAIEAMGRPFDPHEQEALSQCPSAEYPANTVMLVAQRGYRHHDRVLRAAKVILSTGSGQSEQQEGSPTPEQEGTSDADL